MNANDRSASELLPTGRHRLPSTHLAPPVLDVDYSESPPRHLRDYARTLYKYRWLAASCFGLTLGLSVLMTLLAPRLYTTATRVQVSRQSPIQLRLDGNVLDLDQSERTVNGMSSFLATQVATLTSRDLAERVIRTHHLVENKALLHPGAERRGLLAVGSQLLAFLRPRGLASAPVQPEQESPGGREVDAVLLDRYMHYLDVRDVRGTDLVEIRFTTPSPELSAILAAAHTQAYMDANEEARIATDVTAKSFLDGQLRQARERVERADAALRTFAKTHPTVAINQEQKVIAQKISEVSSLVTKAEGQRLTMQTRYEFLTKPDSDPLDYFLDRPGIQRLHLSLLDLRAQSAALAGRLGPKHPDSIELARQQAEVARQLRTEAQHEVSGVRARYDAAKLREDGVRQKLAQLEQAAIALGDRGTRYDLLRGDVATASALYSSLQKQQLETAVNSALAASNIRVIERAEVPKRSSSPKVPLNLMLGVLAGSVLALGATFVCEYFDNSVKSSDEIEGLLQMPALATIPNFALARRSQASRALAHTPASGPAADAIASLGRELVVLHEPWSPIAEAFRALRTAVLFSTPEAPPKMLLVTSAGANEGKTVSSLNLALTLAEAGSRVLLIDVDLRKPTCHIALGIANHRGLSSFLAGQADLASVIHVLEAARISVIPAGPTPPNPAELVGSARMRQTLEDLRHDYDFIILDSPPVLPVTDAVVLAREVDGVVQVVKGHDTPRDLIRRARDQLMQANAHLLGVVVNNVDLGWGDLYFYNRYYGYYRRHQAVEERA